MAATNSKEETIDLHKKHRFSTLTCRAINASLTGATRCDKILYADDLCSGIEEAMSKERLDKLWSAYTNDLKSRKRKVRRKSISLPDGLSTMLSVDWRISMAVIPERSSLFFRHWTQTVKVISITPTVSDSAATISRI